MISLFFFGRILNLRLVYEFNSKETKSRILHKIFIVIMTIVISNSTFSVSQVFLHSFSSQGRVKSLLTDD